ncbi:type II secretion system F family protein [Oceanimonas sp. CHS3-5]|uniref:type II secretion system F family protein n=1 Tax=Oceanimonas sp. CHS3-5 TaxID=3068186 RepID=UPI00273D515D|nr:type II secretion system F family protein [Oceanimonas sp. CHS3-5]MDP5291073.1 type II secretion system F family protein [Oceanimonas sp. CHS3-5]
MDTLNQILGQVLADPQLRQWVLIAVVGLSALTLFWGLTLVASGVASPYRRQLKEIQREADGDEEQSLEQRLVVAKEHASVFNGHRIRTQLVHAGFHKGSAYRVFLGIRVMVVLVSLLVTFVVLNMLTQLPLDKILLILVGVGYVAYLLPVFVLERLANKRMTRMKLAMPDALDLLVVCTEAGLGFKAALQRVAQEVSMSHDELADELTLISAKLRAGFSMQQAFDEFILRTGLDDFKSLTVAINQSIHLGTSIAETLRVYADEYRIKRKQEAEELAAKVGTKMIFPLVMLIWPSFFIVAVGPAILKVFRVFGNM